MNLNEIAIFVKIVETGSFVGAAKALDMPKSTVSSKLSSLEQRLGVTLIRRTTRKLHVTEAGKKYYEQCLKAIEQIMAAEDQVSGSQSSPHGLLRITAPVELGTAILPPVICEFKKKYPEVSLELILTDRTVDLVDEGIDIGIRTGELKDSSLISKKLGTIYFAPFAAPKYLKDKAPLKSPKDLQNHSCIQFTPLGAEGWQLMKSNEKFSVVLNKPTMINDLNLIKALTISGQGISLIPTSLCVNEVKTGKLVRVLDNWRSESRSVHFVYPAQKFVTPKIKVFIEVANDIIKRSLQSFEL
ncbi:MAG: LysR family transcriptional regulator [Bacteriovoracaceae bacterium]|nr:LysR family transcriptional regulator [Bacteriovoracaceae bacterium]